MNRNRNKNATLFYFLMFFFLIKPDYFSFMGTLTSIYNMCFLIVMFIIVLMFMRRHLLSKTVALVLAVVLFPFFVGIIEGVTITNSIIIPLMQTVGLCLLIETGVHKEFDACLNALALLLEIYIYSNFLSIILFPNGLYDGGLYSGNYWLLGYKNVMIRFLLPGVCINAINTVYKKGVHTLRLYFLVAVSMVSLWMVDNKTGFIGLSTVVIMMLLFSKKKLPQYFNLKNALITVLIASILLGTTSIINVFSSMLESLGETVSVMHRQAVWYRAIQLFCENPLFGYGLRSNEGYRQLINLSTGWGYFSHPHNYILFTLIQGGILGVGLISILFVRFSKSYLRNRTSYGFRMLLFMYLAFFVMGMTESLSGATMLYPLVIFMDGFITNKIEYDYSKGKNKRKIVFYQKRRIL